MNKIIIYAGNVTGTGAIQVVKNILKTFNSKYYLSNYQITLYIPKESILINYASNSWNIVYIKRFNNKLFHLVSRLLEVFKNFDNFSENNLLINLGDIPLNFRGRQYLLFHNTNIVDFEKNYFSKYFFINKIFKKNLKFVTKVIVQSPIVKNLLVNTIKYNSLNILVIPMPIEIVNNNKCVIHYDELNLLYPSSFYPHKNFELIKNLSYNFKPVKNINLFLTIDQSQLNIKNANNNFKIIFLNQINHQKVFEYYNKSFALFFPSLKESYGLPLIEAMSLNKIIICADLPYSRWLCEDEAIYFDPNNISSTINAINIAISNYCNRKFPNWDRALSKLPANWNIYLDKFLN